MQAFLQRMLTMLPLQTVDSNQPQLRPLAALTTRENSDPAIAILDAWAAVIDVLDFYQQQMLNEFYLRTSTETQSIAELAKAVGYDLHPGVAADVLLAFTVDSSVNTQGVVTVPKGTQVQSIPSQSSTAQTISAKALPQTFETMEDFAAHAEYNTSQPLRSLTTQQQQVTASNQSLLLAGTTTGLQIGDAILLIDNSSAVAPQLLTIKSVLVDNTANNTKIDWQETATGVDQPVVYAMRQQLGCFGSNAPAFETVKSLYPDTSFNWDDTNSPVTIWQHYVGGNPSYINYDDADLYLSQNTAGILPDSWIVVSTPNHDPIIHQIDSVVNSSLAGFSLSSRVTGLTLKSDFDKE